MSVCPSVRPSVCLYVGHALFFFRKKCVYVKSLRTTVSLNSSTFQCDKYLYYGRFGNYSQLSLIWDQARSCSFSRLKMTLIQRQLVIFENDQKNGLGFYLKNMALTDPSLLVYCS